MIVSELLDLLGESQDLSHTVMALVPSVNPRVLNTNTFGSAHGIPSISVIEGERLPFAKTCGILMDELCRFSDDHQNEVPLRIYLNIVVEHEDQSYDFRSFGIESVRHADGHVVLVAANEECLELREHHPPFDESLYADEEDE